MRKQQQAADKQAYEREQARIAARIAQLEHEKDIRDQQNLDRLVQENAKISQETKQR